MLAEETVLISVVVPTLNEEENLPLVYQRVEAVFSLLDGFDFELVITDNQSTDATFDIALQLASDDPRVRAFRFSKNYGYQRSIYAAYLLCDGAAAVQLDADLQDPPELIPAMLDHWKEGARVVYGIRTKRVGDPAALSLLRRVFYRAIDWLSDEPLPRDAGDFRLVDRTIIELLRHTYDATPYLRGAISASGFHQVGFEYEREDRSAGETKFNWRALFGLAADGIMNHSIKPLHLATLTAMIVATISFAGLVIYTVGRLVFGQDWPPGFATLVGLQLTGMLLNAVFLAIIGSYVGRLFRQTKQSAVVVIDQSSDAHWSGRALLPSASIRVTPLTDQGRNES